MTTTHTPETHDHDDGHAAAHPTEGQYIRIGIILAIITAVEVALYYVKLADALNNGLLIFLSTGKFILVAAYFMHLKFDHPLLRRFFITGFVLAVFVFAAYLMMLGKLIGNT